MATAYNIQLKGYAGGVGFDREVVDRTLAGNEDKLTCVSTNETRYEQN